MKNRPYGDSKVHYNKLGFNKSRGYNNNNNNNNNATSNYETNSYYSQGTTANYAYNDKNSYGAAKYRVKQNNFYEPSYDYSQAKSHFQYDSYEQNWKQDQKLNSNYNQYYKTNSAYSTMASEGDAESELAGFKVAQSGKVILDEQNSDASDSTFSPTEPIQKREASKFASALTFIGPNPQTISMPSFL